MTNTRKQIWLPAFKKWHPNTKDGKYESLFFNSDNSISARVEAAEHDALTSHWAKFSSLSCCILSLSVSVCSFVEGNLLSLKSTHCFVLSKLKQHSYLTFCVLGFVVEHKTKKKDFSSQNVVLTRCRCAQSPCVSALTRVITYAR